MTDSTEPARESDGDVLARLGTDAALWAAEMVKRGGVDLDPSPGDTLHVWLCNAIEAGRSAGYSAAQRDVAEWLPPTVAMYAAERWNAIDSVEVSS